MSVSLHARKRPSADPKRRAGALRAALLCIGTLGAGLTPSFALAEGCTATNLNFGGFIVTAAGSKSVIPTPSAFAAITNTVNTAFLTNSSAFVSAPPAGQPGQDTGGVWARTIAGFTDSTARSTTQVGTFDFGPPVGAATGKIDCVQTSHQDYGGVQVGADIGKLNIGGSGANWHFGITAGYLGAFLRDTTPAGTFNSPGDLESRFEVPFIGLYAAMTQGNFFADVQVRWDFYQSTSSSKKDFVSGLDNDARGFSVTGGAGYRIALSPTWFIEPSVGGVWSKVSVDPLRYVDNGPFFVGQVLRLDDIDSILGRASVRVGANFTQGIYTWQPFISASVIHEFAGKITTNYTVVDPPAGPGSFDGMPFSTSTERFGTYGQIGLGTAIVVGNTGWLGYGRADVKVGEDIQGVGFNAGLRYQW
jgi:hypothetical protein